MRRIVPVLVAVVVGFAVGYLVSCRPAVPISDLSPVAILHISDPAAQPVRLTVHRRVIDGRGETLRGAAGPDIWRIDLAGGRIVLFCSR